MQIIALERHKERLKTIFFNHIKKDFTIECILEGTMGDVFTNNASNPTVFLIKNGPFCILGGDANHPDAENLISYIADGAIILPSPSLWLEKLSMSHDINLEQYYRYSFDHQTLSIKHLSALITNQNGPFTFELIDEKIAIEISSNKHFNYHFQNFNSIDDFLLRGTGYVAKNNDEIIGMASSALVCNQGIEINIMVLPMHRRNGIAQKLASYLIKHVLLINKIPHWDAANMSSHNLANKLGYKYSGKYLAYIVHCKAKIAVL